MPEREELQALLMSIAAEMQEKKKKTLASDDHIPWYIKVFGSTILIIAFSLTSLAFQQCFSGIATVREDTNTRIKSLWEADRRREAEITTLREENAKLRERVSILEKIKVTP